MSGAAWADAVAACTVGTDRAAAPPALPARLEGLAPGGLLDAAAALGPWRMAGGAPDVSGAVPVEPMVETMPECGDAAAARLELILGDRRLPKEVCREWCRLAAAKEVRVPAGLAEGLYRYSRSMKWAAEADRVLGARLSWLRSLDGPPAPEPTEADWTGPDLDRRVAALCVMRADPAAGRAALEAVWKTEPADARAKLLAALGTGLSEDDEPFLDARLDDRSGKVRAAAASLLQHLPGSRWAARVRAQVQQAVQFRPGRLLSKDAILISIPPLDDAARRDGLELKNGSSPGAVLLQELMRLTPMDVWSGTPPQRWVRAAMASGRDWDWMLIGGWARAAARCRDAAWLGALVDALTSNPELQSRMHASLEIVGHALPRPDAERAALATMDAKEPWIFAALLDGCWHDWSLPFTQAVMGWLSTKRNLKAALGMQGATIHTLGLLATRGHAGAAGQMPDVEAVLAPDADEFGIRSALDFAATTLRFRHAMHQEFAP